MFYADLPSSLQALIRAAQQLEDDVAPLDAIVRAQQLRTHADEVLASAVDAARGAGATWQAIGGLLGTTRQAAFQRFGKPIDPRTGEPMSTATFPGAAGRAAALVGTFEGRGEPNTRSAAGLTIVDIPLEFEAGDSRRSCGEYR